jgi:predicted DNA-binding transcriptional regulator YafY
MRASRLLTIQMLLETRGRMSASALAEALEISVRTLHRDIDELSAAGVPVYAERGRSGGFQLLPGWKTTLTGLTPAEAQAVFLGGLAGPAADLGLRSAVQSAELKLLTALPAAWRDDAKRIASRLHLDPIDWYREAAPLPHLGTVADAVWHEKRLAVRYESWLGTGARTLHPLGLVLKAGTWYLVAASEGSPRTYRVSNILEATVLDQPVKRPRPFDLADYWRASVQRFEAGLYTAQAVVQATPAGLKQLGHLNAAVAKAVATAPQASDTKGRTRLRIPIESIEHATRQLLSLSPEVEVLGPAALRRSIVARLAQHRRMYEAD